MPRLPYRVVYNQDCTNLFVAIKEPLRPEHVDRMVDEVADGGADVLLVNPNAQRVNYPSRAWQTFWDGYAPGRREFFGPLPDAELPGREHWVSQMKRLADQGCDYLARALAHCSTKGVTPGVTVRMNDMHDVPWPGSNLFSRFYMEHPELRLSNPPACGWSATGLNYEHAAVREHYLELIREIVAGYEFDVLELDFLRFSSYFPRADFPRHCAIMTGFIREVRGVLASANRRIALTARVATMPAAAYELGFDLAAWAREGLVDAVTFGAFLNTAWDMPVDEFRQVAGDDIALYACADFAVDRRVGLPERSLPRSTEFLRGFASAYRAAGADGIEFFNFFCSREGQQPQDPLFGVLRELQSPEQLRGKPKAYAVTAGWGVGEVDGPVQVPVVIGRDQHRVFRMLLAAEPPGTPVEAEIVLEGEGKVSPADLWLHVNATAAGPAREFREMAVEGKRVRSAIFAVPAAALQDGANRLFFRNEGELLTVLAVEVRVR